MTRIIRNLAVALPLCAASLVAFAAPAATVKVSDCWIRSMPGDVPSGGYFKLMNTGDKPVDLDGVSTKAFGMAMLHQTQSNGSTSKMVMLDKVTVPAHAPLAFAPGGYHLMLEQPVKPLKVGSSIPMTFEFSDGARVDATCAVRNASGMASMQGMSGMSN
ncbi:copper chaperone PCu(A)C [Paraburkholderia sp.]|uniref:copper chaperone PCu(A)C n=1 Tax=Paraburkholderia sp. TaxID=1926495 RepID=UPI002395FCA9|nr:copper chaperone PCu(A)C [Paraburkholderia sp.]MDE1180802.1 copper chaperone PCu(A)C [Paraburkholderia sp.]